MSKRNVLLIVVDQWRADPRQFRDVAGEPDYANVVREYAQRMRNADRTLTHYRATPEGLEIRIP